MRNYLPPGVSRAPETAVEDDIRLVRTDIAGFVGYAERGPLAPADSSSLPDPATLAIRLTSWAEYRTVFGGLTPYAYLPYAVRAFFENGGKTCYVVRVASSAARPAAFSMARGDFAAQVTTLTQPVKGSPDATSLTVDSTAEIVPGAVVGVGATATDLSVRAVQAIVDAHTLTLAGPIDEDWPKETSVWLLSAAPLTLKADQGAVVVVVSTTAAFQAGDVVAVTSDGIAETAAIDDVIDATTVRLTGKLRGDYPTGALLRRQRAGLRFEAASPGNWGNRLLVDVTPRTPGETVSRFDLRVSLKPGPDQTQPPEAETFLDLSLDPDDRRYALTVVGRSSLVRLSVPDGLARIRSVDLLDRFPAGLIGGRDGLAAVTSTDFIGGDGNLRGLRVLEVIDEVGILVAPDAVNGGSSAAPPAIKPVPDPCKPAPTAPPLPVPDDPTAAPPNLAQCLKANGPFVYQAMIDQARRLRYRVAVLDTPDNLEPSAVIPWLQSQALPAADAPFAAVYYPWLKVPDGLSNEVGIRRIPPGGHVAGVYARIDNTLGVQHPPANVELEFVVDVGKDVSGPQQGQLNEQGINVIRSFPGRGIRVWGARSLAAGPNGARPDWWFIHVRRTMSMIEDSVEKSMGWTVFESNDHNLRRTLTHSLNVFMERVWLSGGLKGVSAGEAFYVKCDDTNNPQAQVDQGLLVCEVGVAVAAPMEFLTFQVRRLPDGTGVVEA
jgi:phage tail sheath protein FI